MLETRYERKVVADLLADYPGAIILKNDPKVLQGVPDRIILFENRWAALEFKKSSNSPTQPNQGYYVDKMNEMSFAAFIYPQNEEEVLNELQLVLRPRR